MVVGPFRAFQYCYCSRCRKRTGSAHAANLFVAPDQLRWERGEDQVERFELPEAKYWCASFCRRCGSAMPWLNKPGTVYVIGAGALDDDPEVRPVRAVYYASRAPWYREPSELDLHDTLPPRQS